MPTLKTVLALLGIHVAPDGQVNMRWVIHDDSRGRPTSIQIALSEKVARGENLLVALEIGVKYP